MPDADQPAQLARVHLGSQQPATPEDQALFEAIPQRHTNRQPFTSRPVPEELLAELQAAARQEGAWIQIANDATTRTQIGDLIAEGDRIQWGDAPFRHELAAWIRANVSHRQDGIPGYAQGMPTLMSLVGPFVIRTFNLGKSQAAKDRALADAAPVLAVLGTDADTPRDWLNAGQALARVLLRACAAGVSASFFNQPIEVPSLRPQLQAALGRSGMPQIMLRLGYGPAVRPTPRRSVSEVLLPSGTSPPAIRAPQRTSRRKILVGAGVGMLVLVSGGAVWRAEDQGVFSTGQGPAYEPWYDWRSAASDPLNLVRAVILAANPHNTQPWLFHVTDARIDVFADLSRKIGLTDPFLSEMHFGLGCALENLLLAAPAYGYTSQLTLLPDASDPTAIARIDLVPGITTASDLYQAIPHRHTNRYPYDTHRPVPSAMLAGFEALNSDPQAQIFWFASAADRQRIGDLMIAAAHAFVADTPLDQDDNRWYRATWQDVQHYRDGITLDASGLSDFTRFLGKMLPPQSLDQQNSYFLQGVQTQVRTAGALGILAVPNKRDDEQRMRAGRLWQRMHLWATTQGMGMQPLNQMTEMADREVVLGNTTRFGNALVDLVGDPAWQALFSFRLGYTTHEALLSPRRPISAVLKP